MKFEKKQPKNTFFEKWFLNNRFSIVLINFLLFLIVVWLFNKVSFILNPACLFLSAILPPLVLATVQYYIMNPLVDVLERKYKVPRGVTIILLFVVVVLVLIWAINILFPIVQDQINSLINNWPQIWHNAVQIFQNTLSDPHLNGVKNNLDDMINKAQSMLFTSGKNAINSALINISSAISVIVAVVTTLFTAPFILFFMLKDGHKLRPFITKFMPKRWQSSISGLLYEINAALSSYIRGQITVAFWVGIMFAIGYSIIGQPYAIALAVLSGVMNLIPYFGTLISVIPALIIAIIASPIMLLKVLIVFGIEQMTESRVISPLVLGNKMSMHPVTTILLLLGAASVSGLWGVIFGIPIYAVLKIIVVHVYDYYRRVSHVFTEDSSQIVPVQQAGQEDNSRQQQKQDENDNK